MNQLNVNQQQTILTLRQQGWSKRRIARELGLDRATVRKYLAEADSKSPPASPELEQCIRVQVTWADATWVSVAFISGPAKPPWWGETNRGRYFNLGGLTKKKLVFYARGEHGGEAVQAQMAVLGDRPFGDSIRNPIMGDEFKLTRDWVRHEIDLKDVSSSDLARICNGFGVIVQRASQPGTPGETQFYIDNVYFE